MACRFSQPLRIGCLDELVPIGAVIAMGIDLRNHRLDLLRRNSSTDRDSQDGIFLCRGEVLICRSTRDLRQEEQDDHCLPVDGPL